MTDVRKYKYIPGEFDLVSRPSYAEIDEEGNKYWNKVHITVEEDEEGKERYFYRYLTGHQPVPEIVKGIIFDKISNVQSLTKDAYLLETALLNCLRTFLAHKRVIIGLGPGRCGTNSLTILLGYQPEVLAYHETKPRLGWYATVFEFVSKWARLFAELHAPFPLVADVAFWYLPFVDYIMYICPLTKFVCLERDIEATVRSHMLKYPDTSPWTIRNSENWNDKWNYLHVSIGAYPMYDLPKEEACRQYVTDYYRVAEKFQAKYPNSFKIFPVEYLNSEDGREKILDFCGVQEKHVDGEFYINKTGEEHKEVALKWQKDLKDHSYKF